MFADRAYCPDGSLVPRDEPNPLVTDPGEVADRALRLVQDGEVIARTGDVVALRCDTMCVHGDTPGAGTLAARIRSSLEAGGVRVLPLGIDP